MPLHGWPANSKWLIESKTTNRLCARLKKSVNGAKLTKEIELRDRHPFVYQRHTFTGSVLHFRTTPTFRFQMAGSFAPRRKANGERHIGLSKSIRRGAVQV